MTIIQATLLFVLSTIAIGTILSGMVILAMSLLTYWRDYKDARKRGESMPSWWEWPGY